MDPLTALREFTIRGEVGKITRHESAGGDEFRFGDEYHFPCSVETAYRAKQGGLYNLESLVFFVKNSHLKHTDYLQQARTHKLQIVTFPDRKPLLDYLEGKVASTDAIEVVVKPLEVAAGVEEYCPEDPTIAAANGFFSKRIRAEENQRENENPKNHIAVNYTELIKATEKPLKDREALLECKNKNFQNVISVASQKDEERKSSLQTPSRGFKRPYDDKGFWKDAHDLGIDSTQSYINGKQKEGAKLFYSRPANPSNISLIKGCVEGVPIIIVPSAFQTLLNMYNAKEFLEDGVYHPPDVMAKKLAKKPDCITIQKKINRDNGVSTFEVRDKPSALAPEDWGRVTAVFVLGKEWQFKDWPFKDHVEIFNKVLGFFLRFEDDSVESAKVAKKWNVKIISLSKHKRHQDKTAALEIWDRLEEFVRSRRCNSNF